METPSLRHDITAVDANGSSPPPPIENASVPDDWKKHIHPNGLSYSTCDRSRAVTFADVTNPEVLQQVEACINRIKRRMQTRRIDFSGDCEIFVELIDGQPDVVGHLMVDHTRKRTFRVPDQGPPVYEPQYKYWTHFCKTPMHHGLPEDAEDDMLGALAHYYTERISDDRKTTSPLSYEQCEQLISLYETLRKETPEGIGIRAWFVSRVLACIWEARKSYRYGEPDAITTIEPEEEQPPSWKRQLLNVVVHILCFGAHERYLAQLRHAHTNGGLHVAAFQGFLEGMIQEWTDSNLLGTVFISADMAFLAIPQIEKFQQTMILASTFFSMVSILSGVHHLWKHRPKIHVDLDETKHYVHHGDSNPQIPGVLFSAIFLSLPLVFLLWSVISFAVALLGFAFGISRGLSTAFLSGIAALIILCIICVRVFFYRIWEEPDRDNRTFLRRSFLVITGMKKNIQSKVKAKRGILPAWGQFRDRFRHVVKMRVMPSNRDVAETQI